MNIEDQQDERCHFCGGIFIQAEEETSSSSSSSSTPPPTSLYPDFASTNDYASGSRVGKQFQAEIPPLRLKTVKRLKADTHKALSVWQPINFSAEQAHYVSVAKDKFRYSEEQALSLLYFCRYDPIKALADLEKFVPDPDEIWTVQDKALFESAYSLHGEMFNRIQSFLPNKTMSSIMRYYYQRESLCDITGRQLKKFKRKTASIQNSEQNDLKHTRCLCSCSSRAFPSDPIDSRDIALTKHTSISDSTTGPFIVNASSTVITGTYVAHVQEISTSKGDHSSPLHHLPEKDMESLQTQVAYKVQSCSDHRRLKK